MFVYIVRCSDGSLYTGITWNLEKRAQEHNNGTGAKFTKSRRPVKIVYTESYTNKHDAAMREIEIKGWRKEKKKVLINDLH